MKNFSHFALSLLALLTIGNVKLVAAQNSAPMVLTAATAPAGGRPALTRAEMALADPVREALRTLP